MADYNINAVDRKVSYTGSAGLGPYAFSFEILVEDDVAVYFNATLLTLTTDYTVAVNANGTGSITIVTGTNVPTTPDADDTIVIIGARDIERTTDFVTAGDLRASSLNEQLDSAVIFDQQISERVDRAILAPAYDPTGIDLTLPAKADRAGQVLIFDSNGDVSTSALTGLPTFTVDNINIDGNTISSLSGGIIINPYSSEDAEIYDAYLRGSQITVQAPFKDVAGNTMMSLGTTRQALYYSNTTAMRTEEGGAELFGSDNTFGGRIILTSTVAQNAIVDDDIAGSVVFQGYYPKPSGVTSDFVYSTIESEVTDATNGSVNSQLNFKVAAQNTANAVSLSLFGGSTSATGPALTFGGGNLSSDPAGTGGLFVIQPSLGKISFAGNPSLTFGGRTITQGSIYSEGDFAASADGHLNLTNEYDFNKSIPIPLVQLYRDNASPAAADKLGKISFRANDSLGNKTEYANIAVDLDDPTNGSEDGSLRFEVMQGGSVSTAMEIDAAGVTIPGNLTVQGTTITIDSASAQTVDLGDNDKIRLGDGDDLQIYHDGTDSYISNSTGSLKLSGNTDVTGTVTADGLTVDGDANFDSGTLFVDASENAVGIGTTSSPVGKLHITGGVTQDGGEQNLVLQSSDSASIPKTISGSASNSTLQVFAGAMQSGSSRGGQIDFVGGSAASDTGTLIFRTGGTLGGTSQPERMRIDSSGNVGIGTSSPARTLHVEGVILSKISGGTPALFLNNGVTQLNINNSSGSMVFDGDGATERMRIDSSGNVGIGTTSPSHKLVVSNGGAESLEFNWASGQSTNFLQSYNRSTSSYLPMTYYASEQRFTFGSGSEAMRIDSSGNLLVGTTSTAFTTDGVRLLSLGIGLFTASGDNPIDVNRLSSDGNLINFYQASAIEGNISVSGTTVSYNGGHLARWSQTIDDARIEGLVKGTVLSNLDEMCEWKQVEFEYQALVSEAVEAQDEVLDEEGNIVQEAVEAQEAVYETRTASESYDGDANVGDVIDWEYEGETVQATVIIEDNEQLNRMKISDVEGDPNVAGVFVNWDDDDDVHTADMNIAMTGDMVIRIAQGTTVQRGDLLMSAGDGTAKPQGDDIVRSKTIAKVTSTHVSHTYDDGSYLVPCVLMAC